MLPCFFVTDLHGHCDRYEKLFRLIATEKPAAVLLGGDLLPHEFIHLTPEAEQHTDFISGFLAAGFSFLRQQMGENYPHVFVILGNDDPGYEEAIFLKWQERGIWEYLHNRQADLQGHPVFGYACVPPTPFMLKDWERYDISHYLEAGCVAPETGRHTVPRTDRQLRFDTILSDLQALTGDADLSAALFLFHSPPYRTALDRAALDGKTIDHAPLDVHVGSIAIRRLIEERQPLVTLHGHIHESARITGRWREKIGRTWAFSAAHDGPELALVRFDLHAPQNATRELV